MTDRKRFGQWGENLAVKLLEARGYLILERNYRTPYGEMDIIATKGDLLVFVEVKARTNRAFGYPEDAINLTKRTHLENTAQAYLQQHLEFEGEWRIDVIAIEKKPGGGDPSVEWFENAIQ